MINDTRSEDIMKGKGKLPVWLFGYEERKIFAFDETACFFNKVTRIWRLKMRSVIEKPSKDGALLTLLPEINNKDKSK